MSLSKIASAISAASVDSIVKSALWRGSAGAGWEKIKGMASDLERAGDDARLGGGMFASVAGGDVATKMDTADLGLAHKANAAKNEALEKLRRTDWTASQLSDMREYLREHPVAMAATGLGATALLGGGAYLAARGAGLVGKKKNEDEE